MNGNLIVQVDSKIDEKVYRDFSDFNDFTVGKKLLTMALASAVLVILAVVNWYTGWKSMAAVCLILAVVAPILFLIRYRISVSGQIRKFHLEKPRLFYTVKVSAEGISVKNETESIEFNWKQAYRVYELDDYFYIYITKARGYILPKRDIRVGREELLRQIIQENLPEIRYIDKRRRKNGRG